MVDGSMANQRPLRGACHCGRNRYVIDVPHDQLQEACVFFNTEPTHQIPLATPLAAYIRVPLTWYRSIIIPFFPDETHSTIRRVFSHPDQQHTKRNFCGYCGTPLSYWSESPLSEADYIHLTLGSLFRQDLCDLEDMGLIPDGSDPDEAATLTELKEPRESLGVPWFDGLVADTRLSRMQSKTIKQSSDGSLTVEWEIAECADGDDVEMDADVAVPSVKRKIEDRGD